MPVHRNRFAINVLDEDRPSDASSRPETPSQPEGEQLGVQLSDVQSKRESVKRDLWSMAEVLPPAEI